jgi:RecA/RadA recombinase
MAKKKNATEKKSSFAEELQKKLQGKRRKKVVFSGVDEWFKAEFLQCGIAGIDWILGGGLAYGRLSEIFGNFSSGKTYLLYLFLAMNQRRGGTSVLFESEFAYNAGFYRSLGGSPESLILRPARTIQEVFDGMADVAKIACGKEERVAVGWDGIAATGTKHLQETGMLKKDMSKSAGMAQGTQYITDLIGESRIAIIATNQTRETIGDTPNPMYQTHTPGGKSWPFHASQRVELSFRGGYITEVLEENGKKEGTEPIGHWVRARVNKNKLAPPHLACDVPFYARDGETHPIYGYKTKMGIDYAEALFDFYKNSRFRINDKPVVFTSGSWYRLDESFGYDKSFYAKDWPAVLEANPALWQLPYGASVIQGAS